MEEENKKTNNQTSPSIRQTLARVYGRIVGIEVLMVVLVMLVISATSALLLGIGVSSLISEGGASADATAAQGLPIVSIALGVGVGILLIIFIQLVVSIAKVATLVLDTSFGESLKIGIKRWYGIIPVSILTGVLIFGGTILFIVPGVYIAIRSMFVYLVWIEDQSKGAWLTIKESFALVGGATKGAMFWKVLLLFVVLLAMGTMFAGLMESMFGKDSVIGETLSAVISALVLAPIYWSVLYSLYESAKKTVGTVAAKKEG